MLTNAQKKRRREQPYTAGSDLAAICGVDPYRSAYDVWLARTGRIDPDRLEAQMQRNKAIECGNLLEPTILTWAKSVLGQRIWRNQYRINKVAQMAVHLDGVTGSGPVTPMDKFDNIEAKSSGMTWMLSEEWGDTDLDAPTANIPQRIVPQVYAGMICSGARRCWVPAVLGGRGFRMYLIEWRQEIADELIRRNLNFIHRHIETGEPPTDCVPSPEFVRALKRQPEKTAEIDGAMFDDWQRIKRINSFLEAKERELKTRMLLQLNGCDGGTIDGVLVCTNKTQTRKAYSVRESTNEVLRETKDGRDRNAAKGGLITAAGFGHEFERLIGNQEGQDRQHPPAALIGGTAPATGPAGLLPATEAFAMHGDVDPVVDHAGGGTGD